MEPIQCYVLCILILIYLDFKRFFSVYILFAFVETPFSYISVH